MGWWFVSEIIYRVPCSFSRRPRLLRMPWSAWRILEKRSSRAEKDILGWSDPNCGRPLSSQKRQLEGRSPNDIQCPCHIGAGKRRYPLPWFKSWENGGTFKKKKQRHRKQTSIWKCESADWRQRSPSYLHRILHKASASMGESKRPLRWIPDS